jgi:hypothetical protein
MMESLVPGTQGKWRWLQKGDFEENVRGRQLVDIECLDAGAGALSIAQMLPKVAEQIH